MPDSYRDPATLSVQAPERIISRDVQLTNAQVLALLATPQTLVPAPGAGLALVVESVFFYFDSAGAYTVGTANLKVEYASGADIIDVVEAGFVDQATDQARHYTPAAGALTPVANSAVRLASEVAELTGGNAANTMSVRVFYRIVAMAPFS